MDRELDRLDQHSSPSLRDVHYVMTHKVLLTLATMMEGSVFMLNA